MGNLQEHWQTEFRTQKTVDKMSQMMKQAIRGLLDVDLAGNPTSDVQFNPNNSCCAIEGIISPDGRVFGKMGHSERIGHGLYKNVDGDFNIGMFASAVEYFK